MSNQLQGDIAEILAMSYFIKQGHLCSKPISHSSYYDFIVDIDGVLYKVETKSSSFKKPSGNYEFSLVTKIFISSSKLKFTNKGEFAHIDFIKAISLLSILPSAAMQQNAVLSKSLSNDIVSIFIFF